MIDVDSEIGNVVVVVPVTCPSQLSVAVGAVSSVISHCAVKSGKGSISGTEAIVSIITTSCI